MMSWLLWIWNDAESIYGFVYLFFSQPEYMSMGRHALFAAGILTPETV